MRPTWLRVVCLVALPAACVWASGCVISELDTTDLQLTCEDGGCPGGDGVDPVEGEGEGEGGVAEGGEGECEGGSPDCQDPPVEGEGEGEPGAPRAVALQIKPVDDAAVAGEDLAFVVRSVGGIGQDAPSDLNVTLSLAEGPDGAELAGTTERALVEGVANFEGIVLTRAGAGYVLLATTEGLDPGRSDPFDVRPGPAVELRFTVEPPNGRPGQPLTPPLEVGVVDRLGNATSPDGNISVTLGLAEDPTELAVLSATPVGGAGPTFEFAGVQINRAGAGFHLSAHADGLADGRSRRFSVAEAGAPDLVLTMGASGGADAYTDLISDGDGGVIVTGAFTGDHLVEDQVLGSAGGTDIVLARFDADGGLVWARSFGGPGDDRGVAVSLAGLADGLRLAGLAAGGARFDNAIGQPTVIGDAGGRQVAFVASVNPDTGDLVLVQPITDVAVDLQDMACSVLAYCYLTGGFKDAVAVEGTFAEGEALAPLGGGRGDAFFLGFGPAGRLLWAHAGGERRERRGRLRREPGRRRAARVRGGVQRQRGATRSLRPPPDPGQGDGVPRLRRLLAQAGCRRGDPDVQHLWERWPRRADGGGGDVGRCDRGWNHGLPDGDCATGPPAQRWVRRWLRRVVRGRSDRQLGSHVRRGRL